MVAPGTVISRLEDFFSNPTFTSAIADFMNKNMEEVNLVDPDEEQPLRNYEIYKEYQALVEEKLSDYLKAEGLSIDDVMKTCQEANTDSNSAACIDYLLASTEYGAFMQLVADHLQMQAYEWGEDLDEAPEEACAQQQEE
eukprot:Sspe_Gene.65331::Locus_38678_Transcript_1_1_Confidence_1.000_Length_606::g.65331::m.65331